MSNAGYGNHDAPPPAAPETKPSKPVERADAGGRAGRPGSAPPSDEERNVSTPGEGALPDGPQGDDVDPGVG